MLSFPFLDAIIKIYIAKLLDSILVKGGKEGVLQMYTDMTWLSQTSFTSATSEMLTIDDAITFLENELKTRSLRSKLEKFSKGKDLRTILISGLLENHKDANRESVERRVRGWLNTENVHSIKKADAIEIAFILGLSLTEADEFVALVSGEKLHWRNADEIVFIFALNNGLSYVEAEALTVTLQEELKKGKDQKDIAENSFTSVMRSEISALNTVEELKAYVEEAAERIGHCHNKAYQMFTEMMSQLETPVEKIEENLFGEEYKEHLTIRDILREYFYQNNVLYAKKRAVKDKKKVKAGKITKEEQYVLDKIQKDIVDGWPDETALSKMKSRKLDVTRKVLILLFLATDKGMEGKEDDNYNDYNDYSDYDDDYELTEESVFEDLLHGLNNMLSLCGFSEIDPRNPFDWVILYCICTGDLWEMDARMKDMFLAMFGETDEDESPLE